jgi:hypothetical protein
MLVLSGCYVLIYKQQDRENILRQFHIPKGVKFLAFDSFPKSSGFFGREGLRITAAIEFPEDLFEEYTAHLNDKKIWKPVRYLNYSPDIAEEYSEDAFCWTDLPLPDKIEDRFRLIRFSSEGFNVRNGKYYCSALLTVRGERMKHNPSASHWRIVGRSLSELSRSESLVILTVAVFDFEKRILYAHIQFSG